MKFCKNLQRVVDISDPEWAPYWTNYKMLKVRQGNGHHRHPPSMAVVDRTSRMGVRQRVLDWLGECPRHI